MINTVVRQGRNIFHSGVMLIDDHWKHLTLKHSCHTDLGFWPLRQKGKDAAFHVLKSVNWPFQMFVLKTFELAAKSDLSYYSYQAMYHGKKQKHYKHLNALKYLKMTETMRQSTHFCKIISS